MTKGKVSIVTRAFNRLEYTTQCVASVRANTNYDNYEHLVLDQASTDGTGDWLRFISNMPSKWYSKVRPVFLEKNVGDWGGMLLAADRLIGDDVEYIAQLDNDITVEPNWLTVMVDVLEKCNCPAVMCKREGVGGVLQPLSPALEIDAGGQQVQVAEVKIVVACWVCRLADFRKWSSTFSMCDGLGKPMEGRTGHGMKVMNVYCEQLEGFTRDDDCYIQKKKYGKSKVPGAISDWKTVGIVGGKE
jgi:glycosyltransferase involved in cell wall biosynthesis